ncbi:MAG: class I SAM-dependent rRNA methyltransferase [Proteobacteria bacterium]|nr:class I SAM-dependent rRNA methyltransferase [Pseudomonadota bacterium]
MRYPRATLIRPVAAHVRRGHPFIWREALRLPAGLAAGDVIDVADGQGRFVARGVAEPTSPIAFRVWTLDPTRAVDAALLRERLRAAVALRRELLSPEVTGYRLCHGENDGVPALQCDVYEDVASLRTDGAIGLAWQERFVSAIAHLLRPRAIVVRNPQREGGAASLVAGQLAGPVVIREGGRRLAVDVLRGQKTGAFLDQRENRDRVGSLGQGRRVLNLFCYTGGFSVAAALGGARQVVSVDLATPAVEAARENFRLNGIDPAGHGFAVADAFAYLEALAAGEPQHDLIIVDPPSFAPNQKALAKAKAAYLRLNTLALGALPDGGWLATASCSSHLREVDFLALIAEAAAAAGRALTIAGVFGAGVDHPTRPGFAEGHYLKFVLARVVSGR